MHENTKIAGVDVSKSIFDVYSLEQGHRQYVNDCSGFNGFIKPLKTDDVVVLESTGSYHVLLVHYLFESGHDVSVVNPLVVKRFIQMKLRRLKTDKSDAEMLYRYGIEQPLQLWEPTPQYLTESHDLQTAVSLYIKQRTSLKNKLHSLSSRGIQRGLLVQSLRRQIRQLDKEIERLRAEIEVLITEHDQTTLSNMTSIPGIGKKTALLMLTTLEGFHHFEHSKQVIAYLGLAPSARQSGSSIRGRSYITKAGDRRLRSHLFMCSFTACKYNPQCRALYERIVAKGKSSKLALIAVCNKLIKQVFAIVKSGIPYDACYKSQLIKQYN